ncbi:MAG: hypothetical protein OEM84_06705 [Acidimicrobiia bacterium]|nr:hypothetical protein [Acidimicrobiia bacterium]
MEVFIVPLIFGLIMVIAVAASVGSRRYEAQWKAAAERLQLEYQTGRLFSRPKLVGVVGGLTVKIDVSSSSSGSSNSVRTRYRVGYPPLGLDLRMSRQTGLGKAAAMFGMGDTKIGDGEFDEAFSVKTSDPQRLSARLSPAARGVLLKLLSDYRSIKITDEQLSYEKSGIVRDAETLTTTTQRLIEAARTLQGASAEPTRRAPTPTVPIREVIPPPPPVLRPDPFDTRPVMDPSPPRPVVQPKPETNQPAPVTGGPVPSGINAEEIAAALFAKKGLSFQIAKQFEGKYRGGSIDWQGEVREISSGRNAGDPTRVTVLVATVRHELFGSVDVEATASILRVPRGLTEGQPVNLRGTLTGIDAMARRLFVEDAQLGLVR